jgi:Na+-transporting NADH:ubiquinone oxidoreductase subunit NqrB
MVAAHAGHGKGLVHGVLPWVKEIEGKHILNPAMVGRSSHG